MHRFDTDWWKDKRIGILGAGREGLATAEYLRSRRSVEDLTLITENPPDQMDDSDLARLGQVVVAPLSECGLESFDILVRSPGISPYRESIKRATLSGVSIVSPSSIWFADHPDARTICITGTKGKSTTSAMMAHVLRQNGLEVRLAGNIGQPLLACDDQAVDWWVIELSSYQLSDLEASPTCGVVLNLTPEHLDWHQGEENYREDKLRLVGMCKDSCLVLNADDTLLSQRYCDLHGVVWFNSDNGIKVSGDRLAYRDEFLPMDLPAGVSGQHNLSNAAAVLSVADCIGLDLHRAAQSINSFRGLPHRLQLIGEHGGVRYFNDSISSTPVSTQAALSTLDGEQVTLIVGGLDRGLDWTPYMESFRERSLNAVIGIPDSGESIIESMKRHGVEPQRGFHVVESLQQACRLGQELASGEGILLLSPGAPSFPHFRDFQERGRAFARYCGFELLERSVF